MMYRFILGFRAFVNSLGRAIVGDPLEDEHHAANGDGQQQTTRGLLVWRKSDNWTAFTDGYHTWVSGPAGIQERLNSERFPWEDDYRPRVYENWSPSSAGGFQSQPRGIILHGTRSGRDWNGFNEFHATRGYAQSGAAGLAWHVTVGDDAVALHLPTTMWGWHCRSWSSRWLGIEFAQPTVENAITDEQVRAAAWWVREFALSQWPRLLRVLLGHSEVDPGIRDGKSDPFPRGDVRNDDLRERIVALL